MSDRDLAEDLRAAAYLLDDAGKEYSMNAWHNSSSESEREYANVKREDCEYLAKLLRQHAEAIEAAEGRREDAAEMRRRRYKR